MFITLKYDRRHYLEWLIHLNVWTLRQIYLVFYGAIIEIETLRLYFIIGRKVKPSTFIVGKSLWCETPIVFIFFDGSCWSIIKGNLFRGFSIIATLQDRAFNCHNFSNTQSFYVWKANSQRHKHAVNTELEIYLAALKDNIYFLVKTYNTA